ncbi:hypothetical protein KSP39_PZI001037 [Platanthera zijinensis]|uniref:Uncharacterized protein n=1 Tax=Platanthera zijinensis TaxID=2320716 RepID=A0AAP0C4X9_9ASPA
MFEDIRRRNHDSEDLHRYHLRSRLLCRHNRDPEDSHHHDIVHEKFHRAIMIVKTSVHGHVRPHKLEDGAISNGDFKFWSLHQAQVRGLWSSKKFAKVAPPSSLVIQEEIETATGLLDLSTKFKTIKPLDPADENADESQELNPKFRMAKFLELVGSAQSRKAKTEGKYITGLTTMSKFREKELDRFQVRPKVFDAPKYMERHPEAVFPRAEESKIIGEQDLKTSKKDALNPKRKISFLPISFTSKPDSDNV